MDKVTLLPCPFCGGEAEIHFVTGESRHFWAGCWQHCHVYASRYAKEGSTDTAARLAAITAWNTRATPAPDSEKLREALTPSGDTKAAYLGEFKFDVMFPSLDEDDDEPVPHPVTVPWDTIKEIMAAIASRAGASS